LRVFAAVRGVVAGSKPSRKERSGFGRSREHARLTVEKNGSDRVALKITDLVMKQYLLIGIGLLGIVGGVLYVLWLTVSQLYRDWRLGREVEEIRAASAEMRRKRREQAAKRLDNGCDHVFDQGYGEFPPNVCARCGLEKTKPSGPCDHQWQRQDGNTPGSYCTKCGKQFRGVTVGEKLT
jgi:hypothetical protein